MRQVTTIGFDADDTLWESGTHFQLTETWFRELLVEHGDGENISRRLLEVERRNLEIYGFGIKAYTLSLVETAVEVSQGRISGSEIAEILSEGRAMLRHPVATLPGAREAVEALAGRYRLVLITKGDLFDQERKLAASGLGELFDAVEIVSDKSERIYRRAFERHGDGADRAMMVGNSLRSDILPALAAGAWGTLVPHELTWAYEHDDEPAGDARFRSISTLGDLAALLDEIG